MAKQSPVPVMVRTRDLAAILPLSLRHIGERVTHLPSFPTPVRVGRIRFWNLADVLAWLMKKEKDA